MITPGQSRRALGRLLTRLSRATVSESLALAANLASSAARIGFTGSPGVGKSTLISRFARQRLAHGGPAGGLAVLAVDPSSPFSQGSILGDRIRMDAVANAPDLFIRSLASKASNDGLADNIADLIGALEQYGFGEILLETVGVGQAEHAIRHLVDTVVVVVQPDSGDTVQAMKAGILEIADIYVVNKADLPGAPKTIAEIRAIVDRPRHDAWSWPTRPVIGVAHDCEQGIVALDQAVSAHLAWVRAHRDPLAVRRWRQRYHLQSLIARRVGELLDQNTGPAQAPSLQQAYRGLIDALQTPTPPDHD